MDELKYYAGIGSRQTPEPVMRRMTTTAYALHLLGWTLRSGGAEGADTAFAADVPVANKQIFLPWKGFNGCAHGILPSDPDWATKIALKFHPRWESLSRAARALMIRNTCQILGRQEGDVRSSFVICWTKDGKASGGTGQALRIAHYYEVPVFNMHKRTHVELDKWLRKLV